VDGGSRLLISPSIVPCRYSVQVHRIYFVQSILAAFNGELREQGGRYSNLGRTGQVRSCLERRLPHTQRMGRGAQELDPQTEKLVEQPGAEDRTKNIRDKMFCISVHACQRLGPDQSFSSCWNTSLPSLFQRWTRHRARNEA
jgi:hypothetical protein